MTDLEKAKKYASQFAPMLEAWKVNAYLAACEAKDAEWRAKTAGLVQREEEFRRYLLDRGGPGTNHELMFLDGVRDALRAFTSGESPDTVAVPREIFLRIVNTLEYYDEIDRARCIGDGKRFPARVAIEEIINGIGKGEA